MSDAAGVTMSLEGDCLVFSVPLQFKRRGGRREIILPAGGDAASASTNHGLAVAVARALPLANAPGGRCLRDHRRAGPRGRRRQLVSRAAPTPDATRARPDRGHP